MHHARFLRLFGHSEIKAFLVNGDSLFVPASNGNSNRRLIGYKGHRMVSLSNGLSPNDLLFDERGQGKSRHRGTLWVIQFFPPESVPGTRHPSSMQGMQTAMQKASSDASVHRLLRVEGLVCGLLEAGAARFHFVSVRYLMPTVFSNAARSSSPSTSLPRSRSRSHTSRWSLATIAWCSAFG